MEKWVLSMLNFRLTLSQISGLQPVSGKFMHMSKLLELWIRLL